MLLEFGIEIGTSFGPLKGDLAHRHHGLQRPTGCGAQDARAWNSAYCPKDSN